MKKIILLMYVTLVIVQPGCSQKSQDRKSTDKKVGGGCEGCEAVYEYGSKKLTAVDTLPDYNDVGPKLIVSGTIYQADGKTPAKDVILYIYHTDQAGVYPTRGNEKGWDKRHGYIRGWIKTGADGKYRFLTLRPASYPGGQNPAHIHPVIKEPGYTEYWIDEYLFDDDPILSANERSHQRQRGGTGIIKIKREKDGTQLMERDIILGKNVTGY